MAESYVQVSPDSTGKKIAAVQDDDSNYRQVIEIGGDGTDNFAQVTAGGALKTDASATTQPVSGTFWPVTQPVSGTVAVSGVSGSVAVTGTFWQATQPVSGTVAVSSVSGSVTVAGTVTANQGGAPWTVNIPTVAAPAFGQQKVTTGGTQVQLIVSSTPTVQGVVIQALKGNTDQVYVGLTGVNTTHDGTGNGWELQPGQCSPVIPVTNANLLYINSGTTGSAVSWIGV